MKKFLSSTILVVLFIVLYSVIVSWPFVYVCSPFGKYALDVEFTGFSKDIYSISEFEEKEGKLKDRFSQLNKNDLKNIDNNSNCFVVTKLNITVTNNHNFDVTYVKFKRIVSIKYKRDDVFFWDKQNWLLNDGYPIETQLAPGDYYFSDVWIILSKEDFYKLTQNIDDANIILEAEGTKIN